MSIVWDKEEGGVVSMRISGELSPQELVDFQTTMAPVIEDMGKARLLVLLDGFQGWASSDDWGDMSLLESNDEHLERFAIVGEEQWRDRTLMFALAGLRPVDIQFFTHESDARSWLTGGQR